MTLEDSHAVIPKELNSLIKQDMAVPILITQAAIFPEGRVQTVLMRGIEPSQKILGIPTSELNVDSNILPVMVGHRMAKKNSLKKDSLITIRWRDANGTFDAVEGEIVEIMNTQVPTIDSRQLWVPIDRLQKMMGVKNEATMLVVSQDLDKPVKIAGQNDLPGWDFKTHDFLMKDLYAMVASKKIGGGIMYSILLFLAMIAIFDTQILSIFRRRKEIGTLMALGMTRIRVILMFTLEGMLNGILAIGLAMIYGTPLIYLTAKKGIGMPEMVEDYGYALSTRLYPVYSVGLIFSTCIIIMITVAIVSYLPTRKIAKLKPTEALKGKIQ
jgi:ABC-type lipoprotein release transport system permease subunit